VLWIGRRCGTPAATMSISLTKSSAMAHLTSSSFRDSSRTWTSTGTSLARLTSCAGSHRSRGLSALTSAGPGSPTDLVACPTSKHAWMTCAPSSTLPVASERAVLFGYSEGGPMSVLFAGKYPERTSALVLYGTYAKRRDPDNDYPWAPTWAERQTYADETERTWDSDADMSKMSPGADEAMSRWWAERARAAASPGAARDLILMNSQIDIRSLLPSIRVPTLVLHRRDDHDSRVEEGQYIAERIPGARFVELLGEDHLPWVDADQILDVVEEFLTGVPRAPEPDRVLATVLFTDIVGSTERAGALGDRKWRAVLDGHDRLARDHIDRFRGRQVKTMGDGVLAIFDGPGRRHPLCWRPARWRSLVGPRDPRWTALWRSRATRGRHWRHCRSHRGSRCRDGGSESSAGFLDGQGPGCGFWHFVQ